MYKVTWNKHWGTRFQNEFVTLYFSRKPTNVEILKAFNRNGHYPSVKFHEPGCSGMITVTKISVEF